MRAYLGPLGALVRLPYVTQVTLAAERASNERVTLGGRVRLQTARVNRRSWSVKIDGARPDEIGSLSELLEVGRPPWTWVDPWSQTTNMLTPLQSVLEVGHFVGSGEPLGRQTLEPGIVSAWSLAPSGVIDVGDRVPVETATPVTGSVWLTAPRASLSLLWQNADGRVVESPPRVVKTPKGKFRRFAITGRPASTARSVQLRIRDAEIIARPAITWTPQAVQWHHGQGAGSVVVLGLAQEPILTFRERKSPRSANMAFTVQEVG